MTARKSSMLAAWSDGPAVRRRGRREMNGQRLRLVLAGPGAADVSALPTREPV
jgi:hypothetical protein